MVDINNHRDYREVHNITWLPSRKNCNTNERWKWYCGWLFPSAASTRFSYCHSRSLTRAVSRNFLPGYAMRTWDLEVFSTLSCCECLFLEEVTMTMHSANSLKAVFPSRVCRSYRLNESSLRGLNLGAGRVRWTCPSPSWRQPSACQFLQFLKWFVGRVMPNMSTECDIKKSIDWDKCYSDFSSLAWKWEQEELCIPHPCVSSSVDAKSPSSSDWHRGAFSWMPRH